jgi:hypothetical protein
MFGGAATGCGCSLELFEQLLVNKTNNETALMVMRRCVRIKWTTPNSQWTACITAHPFSFF